MIKVPFMQMPERCDKCPFGMCVESTPLSTGIKSYVCNVDYWEYGKYTQKVTVPFDEPVTPVQCPLIEE